METVKRPAVQRQTLGPLLSTIVPEVLAHAAQKPIDTTKNEEINDLFSSLASKSYHGLMNECIDRALGHVVIGIKEAAEFGIDQWDQTHSSDPRCEVIESARIGECGERFTHYNSARDIITEGVMSGVVMPFKLFLLTEAHKHSQHEITREERFTQNLFAALNARWFEEMLHMLGQGTNGILGDWSVTVDFNIAAPEVKRLLPEIEVRSMGSEYGFSEHFSERIKKRLADARAHDLGNVEPSMPIITESGGCPVRHRRFVKISDSAKNALLQVGIDPASLQDPTRLSSFSVSKNFAKVRAAQALTSAGVYLKVA